MSISLFRVIIPQTLQQRIPVNYNSDFRERLEAASYADRQAKEQVDRQKDREDEAIRRFL
jgi:hypothetical protein